MTTTEHIQRYDPWPHMAHVDNAKTTGIQFENTIATVASVRSVRSGTDGKWSCKFREDTKGPRYGWEMYEGEPDTPISAGDKVEVGLSVKNKDKGGYFYNVNFIRPVESAAPTAAGPAARVADDPGWPGPDTSIPDNTPQPADHRLRTGAEWDEPPSFFHWKERGIQKMSALKAAVEFLAVHDHPSTEALAWRLMNELADGKPYAAMEAPQTAQEPGEETPDANS